MAKDTKSQTMAKDVAALWRARNPLIWIVTKEESRVERYLFEAAIAASFVPYTWDIAQGFLDSAGKASIQNDLREKNDPDSALDAIRSRALGSNSVRGVWIMRDLAPWLSGPGGLTTQRRLRNLARLLPTVAVSQSQTVVVISAGGEVPNELSGHATVIDWPLPDREEIGAILDAAIKSLPEAYREKASPNGNRDSAIGAAIGLSGDEAAACYAKSLVSLRKIDVQAVNNEKRRIISKERVLEWHEPLEGGLDAVGGLENLKAWLSARAKAFGPKARAYGLPSPRGILLVGVPGCGKTMTAKAVSTAWQAPLIRLDMGALKSKFVGESEGNLRKALKVIEAIGFCIVWIDEIEKAMQGATSGSADGGVSADALGTILSWMQERQGDAFVVATANDITSLPPELLRKGRFDETFFVDLPTLEERKAVLASALKSNKRDPKSINLGEVASITDGFTGSEIAALVPEAMYLAFSEGERQIATGDLMAMAKLVTPLSKTADKKIEALRAWKKGRARDASISYTVEPTESRVMLDVQA